jgi:hypothetical protein
MPSETGVSTRSKDVRGALLREHSPPIKSERLQGMFAGTYEFVTARLSFCRTPCLGKISTPGQDVGN